MLNSNLLEITSDAEQRFMVKFLQQQRSGIGNDGKFWLNLRRQSDPVKKYWAWESSKQTTFSYTKLSDNNTEIGECSYIDIDKNGTWYSDDLCSAPFGVVCSYEVGSKNWIANKQRDLTAEKNDRQSDCGEGWIDNTRSSCFYFLVGLLTWDAAESHCQEMGGHLMSIDDPTEQAFIAGLLRFEDIDGSVWIGANCREEEVGYQWSDGKPFVYYNWFPGEPDHVTDGDEECVAMFISNAKWTDRSCGQLHPAVCEKPNPSKEKSKPVTQHQVTQVVDGYCPTGWIPHLNNCFLIQNQTATWDQASSLCRRQGAHLASISNYLEQYLILSQLPAKFLTTKYGFWIGLRDRKDQTFQWEDRSDVKYIKWQNSEPQGFTPYKQGCTYIGFKNGLWADTSCDVYMPGYVCSMPKQANGTVTKSPLSSGCDNTSVGFEGYCYRVISTPETWIDAEQVCKSHHSVLATISSIRISIFLVTQLMNVQPNILKVWVGYSQTLNESSWSSGKSPPAGQPIVDFATNSTTKCGFLMTSLLVVLGDCNEKHLFVCEQPRKGYIPPSSNITATARLESEVSCPSTWHEFNGHCYKEFTSKLPWTKARRHCRALGGRLISVNDRDASNFIYKTFKKVDGSDWWTGYNKRNPKRVWVWSDDSENLYDPWYGQLESFGKDCALMLDGEFTEQNCFIPHPFICEVQNGSSILKHGINNTLEQCTEPGYFLYDKYCYSVKSEKASLSSAKRICREEGSELTSIHSYEETNFILSLQQNNDVENFFWIGLQKIRENGWERWQWYDSSFLDFVNWNNDQNLDVQDNKNCYAISGYQGTWYEKRCVDANGFVCKRRNSSTTLTNPSMEKTQLIDGGCRSPFTSSPINNKCYMLDDSIVTWESANHSCHSNGGSLLRIQNQIEQDYVMSLINSNINSLWIDFNRIESETFRYTNSVPVTYTKWDKNQPTVLHDNTRIQGEVGTTRFRVFKTQEQCVQIYAGNDRSRIGKWNVKYCLDFAFFICEKPKDSSIPKHNIISQCPTGYEGYKRSCYKFGVDSTTFYDAQRLCQQENGHLASIPSVFEYGFVRGFSAKSNLSSFWLGLHLSKDTVLYRWTDGLPYLYHHWKDSEPSQRPGEECVISENGPWMDVPCTNKYPYLCKIDLDRKEDIRPLPVCMPTGIAFDGACYYVERKDRMPWIEARQKCQKYGMELVSVKSTTELEVVREIIVRGAQNNVWIGLTNLRKESDLFQNRVYWYWSTGEDVGFTNWAYFEPSDNLLNSDEECVYMDYKGLWYDETCDKEYAFMCKHNGSFAELHTSRTPMKGTPIPPKRNLHNSTWTGDIHNKIKEPSKHLDDQPSPDTGMTIGVTLGVLFIVVLLIIIIVYFMYRKNRFSYPTTSFGFTNAMYEKENSENY
ncbi:macrophage mannose receptor 1-like isoform X2 [Crassostrea virginica]